MNSPFQQDTTGPMTYPARGTLNRLLFKAPVIWWRMGLGPLLKRRMLLLTTWGRKSRLPRHTMLSYTLHAGKAYLISGWGQRTDWYQNAIADGHTTVQLGGPAYHAFARRVVDIEEYATVIKIMLRTGGDAHFKPWLRSLSIAYDLDDLIAKRDRVHLVALDQTDQVGPPPRTSDLVWVWPAAAAGIAALWVLVWLALSVQ
jgi:deazaflavin-dependent oxidoreductase (nitroreductase family)